MKQCLSGSSQRIQKALCGRVYLTWLLCHLCLRLLFSNVIIAYRKIYRNLFHKPFPNYLRILKRFYCDQDLVLLLSKMSPMDKES